MIITDPNQIDLTGSDSRYKRNLRRFKIFTANQLVDLQDTAYLNTIEVYEVTGYDENNNPILNSLNRGSMKKEWSTDTTNIDVTATSKAKSRYNYTVSDTKPVFLRTTDTNYIGGKTYYYRNYSSTGSMTDETGQYDYAILSTYTVGSEIPVGPTSPVLYEMNQATWDYTLVNGFQMNDTAADLLISGEYEIAVSYQGLEIECTAISRDNLGPEYSPGLMRSVLDKIEELYYVRNPIVNVSAKTISDMHCLEEDLTGSNPANYITGEVHRIDVANNLFVIRPQCGSFYNTDTLKLQFKADSDDSVPTDYTLLVKDVDYVVTGINREKTAISDPNCGVYEYIVLKQSYTGKIVLSYQAFGGEVTQADINVLKEIIQNIYQTIYSSDIVTLNTLPKTSIIKELIYRQQLMEHTIGHYQSQKFKYETKTTDQYVNIAFVDRNPWTTDAPVPTSCIGEFRITIPTVDFFMDIKVNFDVYASDPLSISVYHADIPSFEKNSFDYFRMRVFPKFRLIWCNSSWTEGSREHPATDRGIMLQMSLTSVESILLDVLIEDMTGAKSPWDLVDTQGTLRPSRVDGSVNNYGNNAIRYGKFSEDDHGIRTYVFDWKESRDRSSDIVPLYPKGYTIFVGRIPITKIEEASLNYQNSDPETGDIPIESDGYTGVVPCIVGQDIDLSKVKTVEFKIFDRLTEKYIIGKSEPLICKNDALVADAMYYVNDLCMISCTLTHDNGYSIVLYSRTGTNSLNNDRFDLVQINLIG